VRLRELALCSGRTGLLRSAIDRMDVKAAPKSRSIFKKESKPAREAKQPAESKREAKEEAKEDLEWSDEEGDYLVHPPKCATPEPFDLERNADQPKVTQPETHSVDPPRSKLFNDLRFGGDAIIHQPRALLPREIRKPQYDSFRLPLPYTPQHVKDNLGMDVIEHLWSEFLLHGADESELIQVKELKPISKAMKKLLGYKIPLMELEFSRLELDDYVEFRQVVLELALWADKRQKMVQQREVKEHFEVLGRCCACEACTIRSFQSILAAETAAAEQAEKEAKQKEKEEKEDGKDGEEEEEEEDETGGKRRGDGVHSLHVAWVRYKLAHNGTVRVKHICDLLDEVQIPYDKSRIPSGEWTLHSELLLTSADELQDLCERIRTDKDYERNKAKDDIYSLPRWMETEFSPSEIMLFKHQFKSIDLDAGGTLDAGELMALTVTMGNPVTEEQAQELIDLMDVNGTGSVDFAAFMMLLYKIQNGVIDLEGNFLAQAMVEAKSQISIFEEIEELHSNPPPYGHVGHYGGNPVQCDIAITGPETSLYAGGTYRLRVVLLNGYPYRTPDITFLTRVYHINVLTELDGMGYFPHIKHIWDSSWNLRRLVAHIVELLEHPRLDLVPIELTRIVDVFLWQEKEKRRIAEEERLAELARLAEIERLAELERIEREQRMMAHLMAEERIRSREAALMSREDIINEFEIHLMSTEDFDAPLVPQDDREEGEEKKAVADDEKSEATFSSAKDQPNESKLEFGNKGAADEEDDWELDAADAKPQRAQGLQGKIDMSAVEVKLSSTDGEMMVADGKGGGTNSRRGSKCTPQTARSAKEDDEYEEDEEEEEDEEAKEAREVARKKREQAERDAAEAALYSGLDAEVMLAPLMRVEQMHLTVIQLFKWDVGGVYADHVKDYVKEFAWTTKPDPPKKIKIVEDEIDDDVAATILAYEKEDFSVAEISENLKAEFSLNISAASVAVWQHKRLEKPLEIEDVWGSDPWDDAEGKDSSDEEDGRSSPSGKADEKAVQEGDFDD